MVDCGEGRLWRFLGLVVLTFAVLSGCAGDGSRITEAAVGAEGDRQAGEEDVTPTYLIGPGDQLQVFVWGSPELSANVPVRPDGRITTPLVEDVEASGKTPTELARLMEKNLSKYIKNPVVTVTVTGFVGRFKEQVRVIGQAAQPQALPYRENMTVLDAIIAVGGLTEFAAGNSARIIRVGDGGERKELRIRLDDLINEGEISENIELLPGDILVIPESWF